MVAFLESLSDEKVTNELAVRKTIQDNVTRILASKGQQDGDMQSVRISKEGFDLSINQSNDVNYPYSNIEVINKPTGQSKGGVKSQRFILIGGNPLTVETYRYGSDTSVTTLAREEDEEYITTMLEVVA